MTKLADAVLHKRCAILRPEQSLVIRLVISEEEFGIALRHITNEWGNPHTVIRPS
jgi:hypothetical protein